MGLVISRPSIATDPADFAISPPTMRNSVVFPHPLGPKRATSSPSSNWKLASSKATTGSSAVQPISSTWKTLRTFLITPNAITVLAVAFVVPKICFAETRGARLRRPLRAASCVSRGISYGILGVKCRRDGSSWSHEAARTLRVGKSGGTHVSTVDRTRAGGCRHRHVPRPPARAGAGARPQIRPRFHKFGAPCAVVRRTRQRLLQGRRLECHHYAVEGDRGCDPNRRNRRRR